MRPNRAALILALAAATAPCGTPVAQVITEICYSAEQPAAGATPPTSSTPFRCPASGTLTLNQLAAQGFRVVRLGPVAGAGGASVRQQLLVKRVARIHASGFEAR